MANTKIHDVDCINLNPATNVLNPRAEAVLARGLGSRPSLGYPGNKYEMGLEAIEAHRGNRGRTGGGDLQGALCRNPRRFGRYGEPIRLHGNGKTRRRHHRPADHNRWARDASSGGLCRTLWLNIHAAPISADGYSVDVQGAG